MSDKLSRKNKNLNIEQSGSSNIASDNCILFILQPNKDGVAALTLV